MNQQSAALTPHRRQYRAVNADDSEQVHVKHLLKLFDWICFGDTQRADSSIIDDHVYTTGAIERLLDGAVH